MRPAPPPDGSIETWIASLFSPGAVAKQAPPELVDDQLFPDERASVSGAVAKRRAEFGTARVCARRALAELGIGPVSLVPRSDRAPAWPDGVVGSISHTNSLCAVVVQKRSKARALGLDVEEQKVLSADLVKMICTPRECRWLSSQSAHGQAAFPSFFFSAKEAYYKCQYPLTGTVLDFHDVELELDLARGAFRLFAAPSAIARPSLLTGLQGRCIGYAGFVLCGAEVPM